MTTGTNEITGEVTLPEFVDVEGFGKILTEERPMLYAKQSLFLRGVLKDVLTKAQFDFLHPNQFQRELKKAGGPEKLSELIVKKILASRSVIEKWREIEEYMDFFNERLGKNGKERNIRFCMLRLVYQLEKHRNIQKKKHKRVSKRVLFIKYLSPAQAYQEKKIPPTLKIRRKEFFRVLRELVDEGWIIKKIDKRSKNNHFYEYSINQKRIRKSLKRSASELFDDEMNITVDFEKNRVLSKNNEEKNKNIG